MTVDDEGNNVDDPTASALNALANQADHLVQPPAATENQQRPPFHRRSGSHNSPLTMLATGTSGGSSSRLSALSQLRMSSDSQGHHHHNLHNHTGPYHAHPAVARSTSYSHHHHHQVHQHGRSRTDSSEATTPTTATDLAIHVTKTSGSGKKKVGKITKLRQKLGLAKAAKPADSGDTVMDTAGDTGATPGFERMRVGRTAKGSIGATLHSPVDYFGAAGAPVSPMTAQQQQQHRYDLRSRASAACSECGFGAANSSSRERSRSNTSRRSQHSDEGDDHMDVDEEDGAASRVNADPSFMALAALAEQSDRAVTGSSQSPVYSKLPVRGASLLAGSSAAIPGKPSPNTMDATQPSSSSSPLVQTITIHQSNLGMLDGRHDLPRLRKISTNNSKNPLPRDTSTSSFNVTTSGLGPAVLPSLLSPTSPTSRIGKKDDDVFMTVPLKHANTINPAGSYPSLLKGLVKRLSFSHPNGKPPVGTSPARSAPTLPMFKAHTLESRSSSSSYVESELEPTRHKRHSGRGGHPAPVVMGNTANANFEHIPLERFKTIEPAHGAFKTSLAWRMNKKMEEQEHITIHSFDRTGESMWNRLTQSIAMNETADPNALAIAGASGSSFSSGERAHGKPPKGPTTGRSPWRRWASGVLEKLTPPLSLTGQC